MNTKHIKKPLLAAAVASTITLGGLAGGSVVSAATNPSSMGSTPSLVDAIANKFHLNKNDVQAVVDQNRTEHQAERQQKYEARLDQAVKDGKLTSAQKDQILAKEKELKDYADSIKDKSPKERHQLMKAKFDELKTWAQQNNIPQQYLHPGLHGPGGHRGPRP